ncbi:microfibril-associated glycoprotein 4-like isoform X1 [Oculina patagonica]
MIFYSSMNYFQFFTSFLAVILRLSWTSVSASEQCIAKTIGKPTTNKALINHVIRNPRATSAKVCELHCFMESECESYNFGPKEGGGYVCELSDSDSIRDPLDWITKQGFVYAETKNPCREFQCPVNFRCQSDFEHDTHQCVCEAGFTGNNCEADVDECTQGIDECHVNATCNNTQGSYNCTCKDGFNGDGFTCQAVKLNKSCAELLELGINSSGVYTMIPDGGKPIQVLCDMTTDGGGWTVFQRRLDGSVDFYLGWESYKNGFGDLNGEFWLGNENLHNLTATDDVMLRVDLEDFDGDIRYAEYTTFKVADEGDKYRLLIGGYSGTAGDSMAFQNGMQFSTKDDDNDQYSGDCAQTYKGAWWYMKCHNSNLNGLYLSGPHSSQAEGVNWLSFRGFGYSLKRTEMKVKPKV